MRVKFLIGFLLVIFFATSLIASSQDLTAEGKKNLRSANMHYGGERFEKAMPLYKLVLEENPNHIETMDKVAGILYEIDADYKLADIYYQKIQHEIKGINAEYAELLKTDEKAAKKFHKKNIKKAKLDDIESNVNKLRRACWVRMFQNAQKETDNNIALEKFEYIYSIAPDSIKTVKMLAFTYNKLENAEKTLEYSIIAAEMNPADDMSRTMIGNTYYQKGNYENALKWYKSAAEINVENIDNYFNMALSYDLLEDNDNALKSYLKVHELDPENLDAIVNLSNRYAKMGDIDKSLGYLEKAVEQDPENAEFVEALCWKLSNEKRYAELLTYANKWKELAPDSENAQNLINLAKQRLNK